MARISRIYVGTVPDSEPPVEIVTITVSGTIIELKTEADLQTGGETIILTIVGDDTWVT